MHKQPGIRPELEAALYENKSSFTNLLKNPPRNDADASLLRKATTEGNYDLSWTELILSEQYNC